MTQKFFKGDLVQVGEMPESMSHFSGNCQAIVMGTYAEQYGGSQRSEHHYTLFILKKEGASSWYNENQLTLIEPDRFDLLPENHYSRKVWEAKQLRDKKEWVGLTSDELNMIGDRMRMWNSHSLTDIYVAIEAKLKEKNGG